MRVISLLLAGGLLASCTTAPEPTARAADKQAELGIMSPEVKARLAQAHSVLEGNSDLAEADDAPASPPGQTALFNSWEDAIEGAKCGGRMVRTGSCYTCRDCGQNTGCS